LKISQINSIFFLTALKDIKACFDSEATEAEANKPNNSSNNLLYLKLYFMYLYNISNSESVYKQTLFNELFQNAESNKAFYGLITSNISDLKMQKFTLGILHNLVFNQSLNLNEMRFIDEFIGFFCLLIDKLLISYDIQRKSSYSSNSNTENSQQPPQEEKDLNEINDWMHLIFNLIMKADYKFSLQNCLDGNVDGNFKAEIIQSLSLNLTKNENKNEIKLFDVLTNKSIVGDFYFIILEILRDCVENSKSVNNEQFFIISKSNVKTMLSLLLQNISALSATVKELIDTKNFEKMDFYAFNKLIFSNKFNPNNKNDLNIKSSLFEKLTLYSYCDGLEMRKVLAFKEFICLVDIFSVFLVTEEYRTFIFELKLEFDFFDNLYALIQSTDFIYDDYFLRYKSLKNTEKLNYDYIKLNQNNVFYSFQTNVMKFLSNYAYKNEALKDKLIADPEKFLAFLNHMKIDNCNPFKKEWTILTLKSLCEGKREN